MGIHRGGNNTSIPGGGGNSVGCRAGSSFGVVHGSLRFPRTGANWGIGPAIGVMFSMLFYPAVAIAASAGAHAFHSGDTSICADCHGQNAPSTGTAGRGIGLTVDDVTEVCLRCHDDRPGIPDVVGADINNLAERSGGFFSQVSAGGRGGAGVADRVAAGSARGGCGNCHAPAAGAPSGHGGLRCIDCHDPHGNDNPRNIRVPSAGQASSPPLGLFVAKGARGLEKYERRNVGYGTLGSERLREVSALCLDCHPEAAGGGRGPDGHHTKHPSYDSQSGDVVTIGRGGARGATSPEHWARGIGSGFDGALRVPFLVLGAGDFEAASVIDPARNGVFCLSCHKAHGSGNPFNLTWRPEGRGIGPRGCDQCHGLAAPTHAPDAGSNPTSEIVSEARWSLGAVSPALSENRR